MDKHLPRRQLRFFCALKTRSGFVILGCLLLFLPAAAQYKLNGYLSAQYENGQKESDFPEGTFGRVRAGLLFSGLAADIFTYDLEVRFKSESRLEIEEAWVGIAPSQSFELKLGFYLVPFGKYNTANRPYENPFIQTPLPQAALYPESWRDVGVLVDGKWGSMGYSVYLGNGLGEGRDLQDSQQFKDNNGDPAAGGRIFFTLSQGFEVGVSYYRGHYDDAGQRKLELRGADITWKSEAILLTYEYGKANLANPEGYERGAAEGHFVLASLTLGEFSPLVSYQTLVYNDPFHGEDPQDPLALVGIAKDISRWAVGLVFSPAPNFMFKVEYDFNKEAAVKLDNDIFLAQVSLLF
ncbi:MAG TPA: hypothetical protein DIW61_10030 [Candidatus Aminicenantes bacterium]|nr:hypothetical protein [Candidatus Aminicenantes bacterium]